MKNRETPHAQPSIKKPPILEVTALPFYLYYILLGANDTLLVIITTNLMDTPIQALISILMSFKWASSWTIVDIIGISPRIWTDKIYFELECVPNIENQHRLNPPM